MAWTPPPFPPVPKGATFKMRRKMFEDYKAMLVRADKSQASDWLLGPIYRLFGGGKLNRKARRE